MTPQTNETPGRGGPGLAEQNRTNAAQSQNSGRVKRLVHARRLSPSTETPVQPVVRVLDVGAMQDFSETIDPDGRITYQTFDDNRRRKDQSLARIKHGAVTKHVDYFNRLAARGAGIYLCVAVTDGKGRETKNVVALRGFWVDLDRSPLDPVLKWKLKPSIVIETSPDRYQAFGLFKSPVPVDQLSLDQYSTIQLKLAALFGGDPNVADPPHVARLPGSWHQKNPDALFQVRVVHGDWEGLRYTPADFERELADVGHAQRSSSASRRRSVNAQSTKGEPAPTKEAALDCLRNVKNDVGTRFDDRNKFVGLVAGIEVMCEPYRGDGDIEDAIWNVYLMYPGNDAEYVQHILDSNLDKDRGYRYVMEITGQGFALAQIDFADDLNDDTAAMDAAIQNAPDDFSENALAGRFADVHAENVRYAAKEGRWLEWDGSRWCPDEKLHLMTLARRFCREAARGSGLDAKLQNQIQSAKTITSVLHLAKSDPRIVVGMDQFDADSWLLNTPAGTVDLKTGQMREHRREDCMTKITAVSPGGDCPRWRAFIEQITGGDHGLAAFIQRACGYALTGSTQEQCLFFLFGLGANGKSVSLTTVSGILGDYHRTAPIETFTESHTDRHPTELAGLRSARLVTAIETEEGRRWNETKIKTLTGGDKVAARFMRQDFFEYTPQFKLFIAGNHKPSLRTVDEAIQRRLHLIPFGVTIPPRSATRSLRSASRPNGRGFCSG
jgi:P4 family phage/plasmid primase-like protien